MRAQIDDAKTVADNIADGNETVTIDGRTRHVISYLQDFLFAPERARTPARVLSGGERNRLLLARLFTKPANVLVMDEPTNDLDAETLDLLEDLLVEFKGTLLIVSHDRDFLDNVVTSTLVFEGDGRIGDYVGGTPTGCARARADRGPQGGAPAPLEDAPAGPTPAKPRGSSPTMSGASSRSCRRRSRPIEAEQAELAAKLADPSSTRRNAARPSVKARLDELEREHATAFARWEELEALQAER